MLGMKSYLLLVGSVLLFFDYSLIQSFVNKGFRNECAIGRRSANFFTELWQQKKQAPVGGDFIELGSSLITLLNLAQEIGSSNNLRFRQAADKLRNQFARSFALRYDLEKSQFLSTALSSIDGDSHLTEAQRALQALVLSQLKGIERKASSIIFFNEPLPNLEEFHYPFSFPYDALKPFHELNMSDEINYSNLGPAVEPDKEMSQEKRAEERNTQYVQSLLNRVKGTEQIGSFHTGAEDMRKLKLGLQVETRKWRAEAAKLMRIQSKKQSPGVSSKAWGRSVSSGDAPVKAMASAVLSEASGDSKSRYRPLIVDPRRTEDLVVQSEGSRVASVPVSVLQEQRQLIRANGGRWRASLELINSAKDRGRARDRDEGIEIPSPYAKSREVTSDSRDTDRDTGSSSSSSSSSNEASAGSSRSYDQTPNYALLIHSCILLSLSTYNLKLSGDWIDMDFHFDSEKTIEQISEAISKAADAFNLSISKTSRKTVVSPPTPSSSSPFTFSSSSLPSASPLPSATLGAADIARTQALVFKAFGGSSFPRDSLSIQTIHSDKACAVIMHDERRDVIVIAFRGTKDPVDLITDITFFSTAFAPRKVAESKTSTRDNFSANAAVLISRDPPPSSLPAPALSLPLPLSTTTATIDEAIGVSGAGDSDPRNMEVHTGFLGAFESIKDKIDLAMSQMKTTGPGTASTGPSVLLTGHSMGGALAQIAAAYYADLTPTLVTFATPSIGNADFCSFLTEKVQPAGGLRVWNEYDAIPYIALLVGYQHVGIPIKTRLKKSAKELFQNESVNAITAGLDVVSPHILFQIGSLVHVFPIIGSEVGAKEKVTEKSKDTEKEKEQEKGTSGDILSRLRANDTLPPLPPLPAPIHSTTTATGRASIDLNIKSKKASENTIEEEDVAGREEAIVRLSGMIDPLAAPLSTFPPTLTVIPSSISSSGSAAASASSPSLHPLDHPLGSSASSSTAPADQSARAARSSPTPIITSNGLDADSVSVTSSVLEAAASTTETDSRDISPSFASSDLLLSGAGTGTTSGVEVVEDRDVSRDVSSVEGQGMEVEAVAVVEEVVVVGGQGSARRKYSYSDEELDEEDNIDDIALAPSSALDKKKVGQASRDFPYHPAFQPVFSIVEKDKTEDFTPDSYYDQFKNEKQFFLKDQGIASDIDNDDADEEGIQRRGRDSSNKKRVETAADYVRRVMGELRQEAVFREIDDSPRRGIMESIWEEIKDAEAVTVSSLSDWMEDKEDEEEDEGDEDVEVDNDDDIEDD